MERDLVSVNITMPRNLRKEFKIYCANKETTMNKETVQMIKTKIHEGDIYI